MRYLTVVRLLIAFISTTGFGLAGGSAERRVAWEELALLVDVGDTIRLVLPDGTQVEGNGPLVQPDGIAMTIRKTSNKALHRKGNAVIARDSLSVVEVRKPHSKGRLIGLFVPLAAGAAIAVAAGTRGGPGYLGEAAEWIAVGAVVAIGGSIGGYLLGKSVDNRFERLVITDKESHPVR